MSPYLVIASFKTRSYEVEWAQYRYDWYQTHREAHREKCPMKMKAEIGVMPLQAKDHQEAPEARKEAWNPLF